MGIPAIDILRNVFGYETFRTPQAEVIETVNRGEDALVLMPTGGGKSLCYQIPAICHEGLGIVVSPLIALMADQVAALNQVGVAAAFLNSSQGADTQRSVIARIVHNELDLLYVAPERLLQPQMLELLSSCRLSLIAIDEAHCVSSWGHDFRQDYLQLHQLAEHFPDVPRMALTATANERTQKDIIERLALKHPQRFITGFDRPNIRYTVEAKTDARKQLLAFLAPRREDAGIVYCLSRRSVERTASWLVERGFNALPYHAGMDNNQRADHQSRFLNDEAVIIVATIAFGMGIDKPDVRFVVHLDLPKSIEAYYQETGRAGRDGQPADAYMVYGLQDVVRLAQMVTVSDADEQHKHIERSKIDALLGWCELTQCRRRSLLGYFGETRDKDCGNCDICLNPPTTWDGTEAGQKALSCVYRTGQRFGVGHIIDVLRGMLKEKVQTFHHDQLSTFGIGQDYSEQQWRSIIRQLLVQGYLMADFTRYGALRLTSSSRQLLRGELTLRLREETYTPKLRKTNKTATVAAEDAQLWDRLRQSRQQIATEQGVPPYVVFHDATLMEMIRLRPMRLEEMLDISGVGQAKLERYGQQFLDILIDTQPTEPHR